MLHLKWLLLITCGVLLLAPCGQAQNLAPNSGIETPYGGTDPNFVAADWRYSILDTIGYAAVSRLAGGGVNSSYSLHMTAVGAQGVSSLSKGAWISIPVTAGKKYQIRGQWRGNIMVDTAAGSTAAVEYFVGFTNTANARAAGDSEACIYKKRLQTGSTNVYNIDTATGTWNWEDISASPIPNYGSQSVVPWTGDTVTATAPAGGTATPLFMTVRVALFTTTQAAVLPYVDLDNVVVTACQGLPSADLNGDCVVNMKDLAIITSNWLLCGLEYPGMCW